MISNSQIAIVVAITIALIIMLPNATVLAGAFYIALSALLDYLNNA